MANNSISRSKGAFRVKKITRQEQAQRKRRIQRRLRKIQWRQQRKPMFSARKIHYEFAQRARGVSYGGIGAMHMLTRRTGLIDALDRNLHLLKRHLPYHESDHVLNLAYNILSGGTRIEDLELLRNDEVYLDALGAQRIPDPTTAGDFCRRFTARDVETLMDTINEVRLDVWKGQGDSFFDEAIVEADGLMAPTTGQCKGGMEISYKGEWGYHPLLVSLANTQEPLYLVNRSGNRPSHEGAAARFDQAIDLCRRAGFRKILLRGDTDFTQAAHLDRWDDAGVEFVFGIDAMPNLVQRADDLPEEAWKDLQRPAKYEVRTRERRRRENVKEQVVIRRKFKNVRLSSESVGEFDYRPGPCKKSYRIVVVCKNLSVSKGEEVLFDEVRYFFYISNDRAAPADQIVASANDRCDQENLIAQLSNGARAMTMPVDNLVSNWAYMVMTSLAWTLKAWLALVLPEKGRWKAEHRSQKRAVLRMEFKTFLNAFMRLPCQIVRQARRITYRLLSWNRWQSVFLRAVDVLHRPPVTAGLRLRC